jgi:hypothetical protein
MVHHKHGGRFPNGTQRDVIAISILIIGFAVCLRGEDGSARLLSEASRKIMDSVERSPRYVCTQTISRVRYDPEANRRHAGERSRRRSCEDLRVELHGAAAKPRPYMSDRIRLDVAVSRDGSGVDGEMYSWPGADRFHGRELFESLVPGGALSTGTFSAMLASIFGDGGAQILHDGDNSATERLLDEFTFQVPEEKSRYLYVFGRRKNEQVAIGYEGSFLINPATADLVQLFVRANLPPESGACELTRDISYERVRLHEADVLLPREARVSVIHTDGSMDDNVLIYSNCREFGTESTIRYGPSAPAKLPGPGTGPGNDPISLPPGLRFRVAFTDRIDPALAAAGDPIRGKLVSAIRDHSRILVPAGAEVIGRIVSVNRFYGASESVLDPSLVVAVKLESFESGGVAHRLKASFDTGLRRFEKLDGTLSMRAGAASLDRPQDSDTGVFEFRDADPDRVVDSGVESDWRTLAP